MIGIHIRADDLNVERRGQTEVEDLIHDVGGQKIKRDAGKFACQLRAQRTNVVRPSDDASYRAPP